MSTKSSSSRDSKSSTESYHRPSGQAARNVSLRDAAASVAATILASSRTRQPGRCPLAAPFSKGVSVEGEPARDRGERLVEDLDAAQSFLLGDDERRIDADDVRIRHGDVAA